MRDSLRSRQRNARNPWTVALCLFGAALPARVGATDKRACVVAHGEAQELWRGAKLLQARDRLVICAQQDCPAPVRDDCAPWLLDIDRVLPSVLVTARDDGGAETTEVRFFVDDQLVSERFDGKAIGVDPGEHRFRFEHPPNPPVEERVALHEGEKDRAISISFSAPVAVSESSSGGRGALPYVVAGAAVVSFASFAYFGITGKQAADACHGQCSAEESEPITTKLRIADISLVTGLVLSGAAAWLFLSRPAQPAAAPAPAPSSVSLRIAPRRFSSMVRCEAVQ